MAPTRMDNNTAVICAKMMDTNYRHCDIVSAMKLAVMHAHFMQIDDPPNELVIIFDMEGVSNLLSI